MMSLNSFIQQISVTPNDDYRGLNQATILSQWENTTQLYDIQEQDALPFTNTYTTYDAWIDYISTDLVNTSKVYSDFVEVVYKDLNHPQNYKGQYYKLSLDGTHTETYICYDRINKLEQVPNFKIVRCNNHLTFISNDGNVVTFPCYLGTDITSTNDQIAKYGTIPNSRMIILVQANEYTLNLQRNQRLMFQHHSAYNIEEINDFMQEEGTDGDVTCIKLYVSVSAISSKDNLELNLCDYYTSSNVIYDSTSKRIIVNPNNIYEVKVNSPIEFNCRIENDNSNQQINCNIMGLDLNCGTFIQNNNTYILSINKYYDGIITLTFISDGCENVVMNLKIRGEI